MPVIMFCNILIMFSRSSRPEVFCKTGFLKNFTKFTGKHLCQSLFFHEVGGLVFKWIVKHLNNYFNRNRSEMYSAPQASLLKL